MQIDTMKNTRYGTIEKNVGETPLQALERFRNSRFDLEKVPIAYAGRLDPMASGKLLVLIGDECKKQESYHSLDKEYEFQILFGMSSDSGDVLGLVDGCDCANLSEAQIRAVIKNLTGPIELPYPHFSSKTVRGKPLHTWTLEGRLNEIEIPTKKSKIYKLKITNLETISKDVLYEEALKKINSIAPVMEPTKALGEDFRRERVRNSWQKFYKDTAKEQFYVATMLCIASSGTYMRTLAEVIAKELGTCGLAFKIHRTKIGAYAPITSSIGFWKKQF